MVEKMSFVERVIVELINEGICSVDESKNVVETFEESSQEHFDMFLLEEELVGKSKLLKLLSRMYEVPPFDVIGYFFDHELLVMFPKEFLVEGCFIPLQTDEEVLTVVMSNPEDLETLEEMGNYVSYNIDIQVGLSEDILEAIEEYYSVDIVSGSIEGLDDDEIEEGEEDVDIGMEEIEPLDFM